MIPRQLAHIRLTLKGSRRHKSVRDYKRMGKKEAYRYATSDRT